MKLVTFEDGSSARVGVLDGDLVRDVTAVDDGLPTDMLGVITAADGVLDRIRHATEAAPKVVLGDVTLHAPLPSPVGDVIAVGKNYPDHAKEFADSGFDATEKEVLPSYPIIFGKSGSSIVGTGAPIVSGNDPTGTSDYEGELGVIIGREARSVDPKKALDHVFGFTIINDVTARELQSMHAQWFVGKSPDTFCPMGPCIVTVDEFGDVASASLQTTVNGEVRQSFALADMIFDIPTVIATLSAVMTLRPGVVIATGTGPGVGIGFDPPRFLRPGDVVDVTVDGIGTLSNPVV